MYLAIWTRRYLKQESSIICKVPESGVGFRSLVSSLRELINSCQLSVVTASDPYRSEAVHVRCEKI